MIDPIQDILKKYYDIEAHVTQIGATIEFLKDSDELSLDRYDNFELGGLRDRKAIQEKRIHSTIYATKTNQYYAVINSEDPLPDSKKIVAALDTYTYTEEYDIWAHYEYIKPHSSFDKEGVYFRVFKLTARPDYRGKISPITELNFTGR